MLKTRCLLGEEAELKTERLSAALARIPGSRGHFLSKAKAGRRRSKYLYRLRNQNQLEA